MDTRGPQFILFSLEPWGDLWYSKQHYAARLARRGTTRFVDVPERWRFRDLFQCRAGWRTTPEGVQVADLRNNLPLRLLSGGAAAWMAASKASRLQRAMEPGPVVIWAFHPCRTALRLRQERPDARLIFHLVDDNSGDPFHLEFARRADLLVAVNPWFADRYAEVAARRLVVPHGIRPEDRRYDPEEVARIRGRHGRHMLLAGSLTGSVNYALLAEVARAMPAVPLVLLGAKVPMAPDQQRLLDALLALPNVVYGGVVHPDRLRDHVRAASVGLVAYDFEPASAVPLGPGRTPLKAITYLAQHLPVVATINSLVPAFDGHGYYKAEGPEAFIGLVRTALTDGLSVDTAVVDGYLSSIDYDALIDRVLGALSAPPPPRR